MKQIFFVLTICTFLLIPSFSYSKSPTFKVIHSVELDVSDIPFAYSAGIVKIPGGFIMGINESAFGRSYAILKFSREGKIIKRYDKRGNGPGELRAFLNIIADGDSIFIAERAAPFVHEFNHNLDFIKDYRVKKGGRIHRIGQYIGIWYEHVTGDSEIPKIYMLGLYDRKTFQFKKYGFEVEKVPFGVGLYGNVTQIDNNRYAGVYSNLYQLNFFDGDFNFVKSRKLDFSGFKSYYPYDNNRQQVPHDIYKKWRDSWLRLNNIFFLENKLLISYFYQGKYFYSVFTKSGELLAKDLKFENGRIIFTEGIHFWFCSFEQDQEKITLTECILDQK
jgi:hypothetical protein